MFGSVLVANRGEIACRVFRTCARLGIRTVAVYSEADKHALHVEMADESYSIGPAPAPQSYLNADAILDQARTAGAEAIHPGYGFLAESADFAERVRKAGFVFIGPSPEAMAVMGNKIVARRLAQQAGLPVPEGTEALRDEDLAVAEAARIGYPVIVKAAGGGGGIGMGMATGPEELRKTFTTARARGERFFGNPEVYLERYLERPRHVEIQVFGDHHGHAVHLFERECSVQRRHQKVIEETPSAAVDDGLLARMTGPALALVREAAYEGAGTVECLVAEGDFAFLEMNARLQVEHPITEETTGEDLVEWQLRIAAKEALPRTQDEIIRTGHAIELRVYAEDPVRFLPSPGRLDRFRPPEGEGVRVETGLREGDEVTPHYDPLLAKVVCTSTDRDGAIDLALAAIGDFEIDGLKHNLPALDGVLRSEGFRSGDYDTHILERLTRAG